ncbi:hypothetical protein [Corynebacterium gerontici]|uniref:Bifunctional glucose-6-phosphate/mannose-6-phosphate isomerase C-terminal domain-containing protein n=1 Tax=Corynebacterium gerontici TaxID=2079234 RepID=A0A3G6IZC4_9CORY|nr:hypothetical protein [Corynebacterium gerontici]AZA10863.1 hypothetical protein CGERO_02695 [Corynebacterium gerontici]
MAVSIDHAQAYFDIAHEGAQIRAVADALPWDQLPIERPRSIVVLAGDELCLHAARAAVNISAPWSAPVTICRELPSYVGPLDVVILLSERGSHDALAQAASVCHARSVLSIAAVGEGPLVRDLPASTHIIPMLPMHEGPSPLRAVATVLAVLFRGARTAESVPKRLLSLADRVDEELIRCAPDHEELNPAKDIAQRSGTPLHVAADAESKDLVALVAYLWTQAGRASAHLDAALLGLFQQRQPPVDPFYDPIEQGPAPIPAAVIRWSVGELAHAEGDYATALCALIARGFAATMYTMT